jgi:hypothetical protein
MHSQLDSQRFRVNAPDVINEVIDGEAIVLHLGTGRYFSARGCGAEVWSWLSASIGVAAVVDALTLTYEAAPEVIAAAVDDFVGYLSQEGLIAPLSDDQAREVAAPSPKVAETTDPRPPFEPPAMETFSDLEDLLLLDPVHEVSTELGWPHIVPEGGSHT